MIYSNSETFSLITPNKKTLSYTMDIREDMILKISDENNLRLSLCDIEKNNCSGILKEYQKISFSIFMENDTYYIQFKIMEIEQEPIEIDKNFNTIMVPIYLNLFVHNTDISVLSKITITFSSKIEYIFCEPSSFYIQFSTIKIKNKNCFIIQPHYMTYPFYVENNSYLLTKKEDNISNIEGYLIFNIINCI